MPGDDGDRTIFPAELRPIADFPGVDPAQLRHGDLLHRVVRVCDDREAVHCDDMFLARVEGSVVSTKKDPSMNGRKLLLLRPQLVDEEDPTQFRPGKNTIVAVDSVGAGEGELVLFCQGSSARLAPNMKAVPVDAVIIGIVDAVDVLGKQVFNSKS